ncbi:MAG: type I-D CRISPR-associated helicase Cas3' [Thermoleophilia bacterium]
MIQQAEQLKILSRSVKQDPDGRRPFQTQTIGALLGPARVITVEAPVGSGKSYIIRQLAENEGLAGRPLILTYPTKILMDAQVNCIKKDYHQVRHWPDEAEQAADITLFEYSTSALVRYLEKHPNLARLDKSQLIANILLSHQLYARRNIFVTTPDVLHLIKKGAYRSSRRLSSFLNKPIVFFDEFHLYTHLENFAPLVEWLLDQLEAKVVFLSATVTSNNDLSEILERYEKELITFDDSLGTEDDTVFNYPLKLTAVPCLYTRKDALFEALSMYLPKLPKPCAIIFDSVFRLQHLKPTLQDAFPDLSFFEYSGITKDSLDFNDGTVVLGTASVEVGVEMPIKSLITEAAYWTSAIQRIGRVGRKEAGEVVLLTRVNLAPYLGNSKTLSRKEFEEQILKEALAEQMGGMVAGEMFRGDSYPFLIIDADRYIARPYTEAVFSMFDIDNSFIVDDWRCLNTVEKQEILQKEFGLPGVQVKKLLLQDKLIPFWGVVTGKLKERYEPIAVKQDEERLTIILSPDELGIPYYFENGRSI